MKVQQIQWELTLGPPDGFLLSFLSADPVPCFRAKSGVKRKREEQDAGSGIEIRSSVELGSDPRLVRPSL